MSRLERASVYVAVLLGGALLMSLEIAAFRIIGKTFGTALRETTAVIAVFLAAMSVGYWAGGRAGDRWPRPETLVVVLMGAAALLMGVPWLDALISPRVAASGLDLSTHAFLATAVLFALPTILFASISPIAVRLFAVSTGSSGSTAGSVSAISTAGSIAGSIVTAFLLIDWLGSIARTVLVAATVACIVALLLLTAAIPRVRRERSFRGALRLSAVALGVALLLGLPALAYIRSTNLEQSVLTPLPGWRTLFVGDSPYHRVTVREHRDVLRILTFDGMGIQSSMLLKDPFGPGSTYSDSAHIARLMRSGTRRVLIIGLGGGTIAKQLVHYYPDTTVDAVDVDPLVVEVAQKYFGVQPSERLRLHVADGRMFLKRSAQSWDLIVVDAYTRNRYGDTVPPHLVTQQFFREASRHLSSGGILHFHCAFGRGKLFSALEKTMASVFENVYVTGAEVLGSDVALITSKESAMERARSTPAGRLPHLASYINGMMPYARVSNDIPLLTDDYAPVDTLR